jgi:hypothetical protein
MTTHAHFAFVSSGKWSARRVALTVFFTSVGVNAILGIYALLSPGFGETEGKVLLTSLSVTGAILLSLVCAPAWERGLLGWLPPVGAASGVAGFALAIATIWSEPSGETLPKLMGTLLTVSAGAGLACLLALATLAPRFGWTFTAALSLIAVLVAMAVVGFWGGVDSAWYGRALGVVAVALAAFVVTIPVFHWLSRSELRAPAESPAAATIGFCPYCGAALQGRVGAAAACPACGARFTVLS